MLRLLSGLALAALLAACSTTGDSQVASSDEAAAASDADAATLPALAPAAGGTDGPAADSEGGQTEVAALTTAPVEETPQVDDKANAYLNCVVGRAAQESQAGKSEEDAVELGIDSCRNQFREARWAYLDTGASESEADRYGVNLLTFVRDEAHSFLQSGT